MRLADLIGYGVNIERSPCNRYELICISVSLENFFNLLFICKQLPIWGETLKEIHVVDMNSSLFDAFLRFCSDFFYHLIL